MTDTRNKKRFSIGGKNSLFSYAYIELDELEKFRGGKGEPNAAYRVMGRSARDGTRPQVGDELTFELERGKTALAVFVKVEDVPRDFKDYLLGFKRDLYYGWVIPLGVIKRVFPIERF